MLDLSNCTLGNAIIHYIASPLENAESVISDNVITENEYFQKAFSILSFNKFEENEICEFHHESELNLNEVYFFSKEILNKNNDFVENSKNIAKHLIEVSRHPNIKSGELLILKFQGAKYDNKEVDILSMIKVEDKEQFLKVNSLNERLTISSYKGINLKQNNKLGLIMFFKETNESLVFVKSRKQDDTVFWKENFLNVKFKIDERYKTEQLLNECRKFINNSPELAPEEKVEYLSKSIDYFKKETFFKTEKYVEDVFKKKSIDISYLQKKTQPLETNITSDTVRKVEKKFIKTIVLDSDINIRVSLKESDKLNEILEKGFDEEKNKKFYKIYFVEEK